MPPENSKIDGIHSVRPRVYKIEAIGEGHRTGLSRDENNEEN